MKKPYPVSLPIRFSEYPDAVRIICGPGIPEPFSYGSRVLLYKTPLCGVTQGEYASGAPLPAYAMVYSNTGTDTDFDLKVSFYGWGTFYLEKISDAYCHFEVRKGIKIEIGILSKKFETSDIWETLIPTSTSLSTGTVTSPSVVYTEPITSGEIPEGYVRLEDMGPSVWTTDASGIHLVGTLQLRGDGSIWYKP